MRHLKPLALLLPALLAACASTPYAPTGPADFSPIATTPAPHARLYADCIGQAATAGTYGRAHDADTEMVQFTCTGAPARAFYDALAARSAEVGSEVVANGRTFRSTNRIIANLFGADHCSTGGAGDYRCSLSFNAGEFLKP
ncbi:hypothetical protein [Brevundimonas kwangchunensis]